VKTSIRTEIVIVLRMNPGEWVMKAGQWSIASASFTVRQTPAGKWGVRIDHQNFRAWRRKWNVTNRLLFDTRAEFPGFFLQRTDLPGYVIGSLFAAYEAVGAGHLPKDLPPIDKGRWEES
jgi:hypothetical protein